MDAKGLNFNCSTCHATSGHQVSGSRYDMSAALTGPAQVRGKADAAAGCLPVLPRRPAAQGEHSACRAPEHAQRQVACQTCHIPEFARDGVGTEKVWDWSTATNMGPEGKPLVVKDSAGRRAFDSKKGNFVWDSYLIPEYRWFNGQVSYKTMGDKIDPSNVVEINQPGGHGRRFGRTHLAVQGSSRQTGLRHREQHLLVVHTAARTIPRCGPTSTGPRPSRPA